MSSKNSPLIGQLSAQNLRFAIVVSRFNELITKPLLEGATEALERLGGDLDNVQVIWVPGAVELPVIAKECAQSGRFDGIICLGAVIRGSTGHYDHVANSVTSGLTQVALSTLVPVIFGVLTTENLEQALERAGSKAGNKGSEAMHTAIEMANLQRKLRDVLNRGEQR